MKLVSYEILGSLGAGGSVEVWLSPYPDVGKKPPVQISRSGGTEPRWSRDGRQLYYLQGLRLISADVSHGDAIDVAPRELFTFSGAGQGSPAPLSTRTYDVAPDGRILAVRREAPTERSRAVLVENWFDELERLAPR